MLDERDIGIEALLARIEDEWPGVIEVGQGWHPLLVRLDAQLSALDPDYRVQQVKSKFGSLRFYARASSEPEIFNEKFHAAIRAAEWASVETCEDCGGPAQTYTIRMWVWTLCEEHARLKRDERPRR